jgi:signal transduction histidine kinase
MCKDIIENAGGKIGFTSLPSMGACFWIEMPLKYSVPVYDAKMALAT